MSPSLVAAVESIAGLRVEWTGLLARASLDSLFLSWEWAYSWCRRMLPDEEKPFIITLREGGRLIGLAPLSVCGGETGGGQIRILGQRYSYHLGFLAEKGREELIFSALADKLFSSRFQTIEFTHLARVPEFESAMRRAAGKRGLSLKTGINDTCKSITLPASYELYLSQVVKSYNARRNIIKDFNRLGRSFRFEYMLAGPDEFAKYWKLLLDFHGALMRERGKRSAVVDGGLSFHLEDVALDRGAKGRPHLGVIKINGEPAAALLGIIYGDVFNALTMGLNPRVMKALPWLNLCEVIHVLEIKAAIALGCREYDCLGGDEKYKYKLGARDTAGVRMLITNSKAGGWRDIVAGMVSPWKFGRACGLPATLTRMTDL